MSKVDDGFKNHPGLHPNTPHALDDFAYREGVDRDLVMAKVFELNAEDIFWKTLGGSVDDPFGDSGETFRQRQAAVDLGIGLNIYDDMGYKPSGSGSADDATVALNAQSDQAERSERQSDD